VQEIYGDLFESILADAICITTNGVVNRQGANIMGRGCAGEAKRRWPGIQFIVGTCIQGSGNNAICLTHEEDGQIFLQERHGQPSYPRHNVPYHIMSFPTKPDIGYANYDCSNIVSTWRDKANPGDAVPGWAAESKLDLIETSAHRLVAEANAREWKSIVLPRPGCGAGELSWGDEVRPLLEQIFDDRFYIITFPPR